MVVFIAFLIAVVIGMLLHALRDRPPVERLDGAMRSGGLTVPATSLDGSLATTMFRRVTDAVGANAHATLVRLTPNHWLQSAEVKMQRLGEDNSTAVAAYLLCWAILILSAVVCAILALLLPHLSMFARELLILAVAVVTLVVPQYCLNAQVSRRQENIRYALPDVTDLLAVSSEAGLGIDGAVATVVRRKPGPIAEEFARLLLEIRLGGSREAAWNHLVERVGVSELQALVSSLQDAEQTGVSIANTLRAQSDVMRVRRSLLIRQLAATLPIKMLFPLIFFILPALFVVVLGPGAISVYQAMRYFD